MEMTQDTTQAAYQGGNYRMGARDGFREQVILLDHLREKMDEYFSLRSLNVQE